MASIGAGHRRITSGALGPFRRSGSGPLIILLLAALCWSLARNRVQQKRFAELSASPQAHVYERMENCGICASSPLICSKYGLRALQLTRAYQGSGIELRRIIAKAGRGNSIKIGVLGGSVSEGIGVPHNSRWHEVVQSWFNTSFPDISTELINGAVPGRGSVYFMSCHGEHIPRDVDLVLIELGINDWHAGAPFDNNMESLIRALLAYPNQPAIVLVETLSLTLPALSSGFDAHLGVANYYDVPVVALRNWLLPELLANVGAKDAYFFGDRDGTGQHNDYLHISPRTHLALGELVNALLDQQLCLLQTATQPAAEVETPWPPNIWALEQASMIPRLRLQDTWDDHLIVGVPHSSCLSLNSPRAESRLRFDERRSLGWYKWDDEVKWRNVKTYFRGDKPGDIIVFSNIEMVDGSWTLSYIRSNKKGLGRLLCWVDDNKKLGITIEGYWDRKLTVGEVTAMHTTVPPGKHDIKCEIQEGTSDPDGGHTFLIIAIMFV